MKNNSTPISPFSQHLLLKREDLSETGSHKFRYFQKKIPELSHQSVKKIVLSTTGNAGISAAYYGKKYDVKVIAVMSDRGDLSKAAEIERHGATLILSSTPIKTARQIAKNLHIPLIRMSEEKDAVSCYESLGEEIIEQVPDAKALVNFCSSGTSSLGIMRAYEKRGIPLPALHIVQSGKSCSIVKELHTEKIPENFSSGVGLFDTPHRASLINLIKKTHGDAWYSENDFESDASFEIAKHIAKEVSPVVVVFSGRKWSEGVPKNPVWIRSYEDLKAYFLSKG